MSHTSAAAPATTTSATADPLAGDRSHLKLTSHIPRNQGLLPARITTISSLSPTVRQLILEVPANEVERARFLPGQWVDFHIPGVPTVGGFSICSTPSMLRETRLIELGVKRSRHPPAAWVHAEAKVGSEVQIEIGGTFAYDVQGIEQKSPVVFLVGGVGITPIISMVRERMEAQHAASAASRSSATQPPSTTVIYSAKQADELVYRSDFESYRSRPGYQLYLSATADSGGRHAESWATEKLNAGRVPLQLLRDVLEANRSSVHVYLCGPPSMVDEILPIVEKTITEKERVHYERWW
jgi:ferredoxin-NADP reductase